MNYIEWKQEYLELLTNLIKQHEYSKDYSNDAINELAIDYWNVVDLMKISGTGR